MKKFDIVQDEAGLHAKFSGDERAAEKLTANQKYTLLMAAIAGAVWIAAICLVGGWAVLCGAVLALFVTMIREMSI